ncbi:hypothetical protein [uncultured Sulfitobacter sp.]|uniref:hypothetical protein n=1 Tax=uncultured Sulfitobacter sp. TaxID=191468 RepID=UPI00260B2D97|nr:hypothetical protein [uncultured Sulfitobacter sp.]
MGETTQVTGAAQPDEDIQQMLRAEIATLNADMQDRFREIAVLTRMLEEAEARFEERMAHRVRVLTRKYEVPVVLAQAAQAVAQQGFAAGMPTFEQQRAALGESAVFDGAWYLETYKDVAQAGMAPEDHYLRAGAFEGRDPGPAFSSLDYYMANPDVAQAGWPALSHYLMLGQSENRMLRLVAPDEDG